jgi:hypothetical protein
MKEYRKYKYTMKYYLAMNKNEITSFVIKLVELEDITLSEISQI